MLAVWQSSSSPRSRSASNSPAHIPLESSVPHITLTLVHGDGQQVDVQLRLETVRPFLGELRITRPDLAATIEHADTGEPHIVVLLAGDAEAIAIAAHVLLESKLIDDPALARLAEL